MAAGGLATRSARALAAASHKTALGLCFHTVYANVAGLDRAEGDYLIDVRPGHAGGYYEFYHRGELEGDDEDDYDAIGGLCFEDPAHELFGFISGLEGLDEDSGWLGA